MTNSELRRRWLKLHNDPESRNSLRPEILYSWERCYDSALDPNLRENPYVCTEHELKQARSSSEYLLHISEPVMKYLYEFVAGTGFVVALTDSNLCVLKVVGDKKIVNWAKSGRFMEGSMWSESLVGTNGATMSQGLAKPFSVFGYEHFCLFCHVSASSSAPITDQGKICGNLSMAAPHNMVSNHTLGMVVAATKHIMSTMTLQRVNQYHQAVMDSMSEGVLVLDPNGIITYMNGKCAEILGISGQPRFDTNISDLLDSNPDNHYFINKITQGRTFVDGNFELVTLDKDTINCNVTCNPLNQSKASGGGTVVIIKESHRIKRLVRKWVGSGAKITFNDIIGQNSNFLHVVETAKTAASSISNVLLLGESGTGKDVIAQAIHNASPRKNHPYVALNCAALPRELIASELFGYDEGAFTGARKGGNLGKFELADQGTIFLDEIGDMPMDLQAALLRVLEAKTITHLGGTKLIPINVRIIAATNKNLESEIKRQRFRRDLYYRLAVIKITIPPLWERPDDILLLADRFLESICRRFNKPPMVLAPEVIDAFLKYQWPGNIRELQNVIEGGIQLATSNIITYDVISEYLNESYMGDTKFRPKQPDNVNSPAMVGEKEILLDNLIKYKYNKSEIAKAMNISRNTLYKRLKEYGIS